MQTQQNISNAEVYSANFSNGNRSYFVNMLEARNSTKYVKITESRKTDDGNFQKNRIMLFQGDLYKLAKVLNTAIKKIKGEAEESSQEAVSAEETHDHEGEEMTLGLEENDGDQVQAVQESSEPAKDLYPNSGKKWTAEDEEKLEFLFKAGKTVEDLTEIFGRKQKGIESRLQKLGLTE
ncbi:MAG TPA: DUF3276 family protein [Clostridiales bacterium]|nr:DUF3276 family protein [Clostridiales bacterium]